MAYCRGLLGGRRIGKKSSDGRGGMSNAQSCMKLASSRFDMVCKPWHGKGKGPCHRGHAPLTLVCLSSNGLWEQTDRWVSSGLSFPRAVIGPRSISGSPASGRGWEGREGIGGGGNDGEWDAWLRAGLALDLRRQQGPEGVGEGGKADDDEPLLDCRLLYAAGSWRRLVSGHSASRR